MSVDAFGPSTIRKIAGAMKVELNARREKKSGSRVG
jgi:hypothetical protein